MNSKGYIKLAQLCVAIQEQSDKKSLIIAEILRREGSINIEIPSSSCAKRYHDNSISYTALHSALDSREIEIFDTLLTHGADFTAKDDSGMTILHRALASSCLKSANCWKIKGRLEHPFIDSILQAHLKANNHTNPRNEHGMSYLHAACMTNNWRAVEFYLSHGGVSVDESINNADSSSPLAGYTGLHLSARYCCLDTAKSLINFNANVRLKDTNNGKTALHLLIERNMEIVDWMNMGKRAAYDQFIADFEDNERMIELLLPKTHRDWKVSDDLGLTRFHVVCTIYDHVRIDHFLVEELVTDLDRSVDMDSPVWPGYTALHFAAHFNVETVKLLARNGANLLVKDANGVTPFDLCLQRYEAEDLHYLLTTQPSWKYILMSDGKTRLCDLVLAMRSAKQLKSYLEQRNIDTYVSMNSPLWSGNTILHLATILPERSREIDDLLANTEYCHDNDNDKRYYNCSQAREQLYLQRISVCLQLNGKVDVQDAEKSTPLHRAFRLQRESAAEAYLRVISQQRDAWNCNDDEGLSHLHIACAAQRRDVIDKLLDEHNVNEPLPSRTSFNWFVKPYYWDASSYVYHISGESTLLHIAVTCENVALVEMLMRRGADVYAKDVNGLTPIHRLFIGRSRNDLARHLFAEDELKDCVVPRGGLSHLHVASLMGDGEAIGKLLDSGADVNGIISYESSKSNDTTSHLSGNPAFDLYEVESSDPMSFLVPYHGYVPLHFAMENHQNTEVMELLVQRGADLLAKKPDGSAPLYDVLENSRHLRSAEFFVRTLKNDEDLRERVKRDTGITMLHVACATLDVELTREILDQGKIDVNSRTLDDSPIWSGCTPLHLLSTPLSQEERDKIGAVMELLLRHGADVTSMNSKGNTPIHKVYSFIESYVSNDQHVDALLRAQKNYKLNPTNAKGLSHFHVACARNQYEIVEEFLKINDDLVNCSIDHFHTNFGGYSPLHIAAYKDSRETIDLLLRHAADIKAEDRHGDTPLHVVAERDDISRRLIEQIVKGGADIRAKNLLGKTLFERLVTKWSDVPAPVIELFLQHGWQVNTFNPVSGEGTLAMAFSASNDNLRGIEKPAFKALMRAPDVATIDEIGRNAIHNIVSTRQPQHRNSAEDYADAIEILVRLGCDYDRRDDLGRTPLHLAVEFRQLQAIAGLLQSGADVNVADATGQPAFSYILKYVHKRLVHDREIVATFAVHLRKMVRLGLEVSESNVETIITARKSFPFNVTTNNEFDENLDKLKERKIGSAHISLHDFSSETGAVSSYPYTTPQEHQAIKQLFDNDFEALRKEFPEVAGLLRLQYKKARERLPLIDPAIASLKSLIGFELPVLCSDVVLKFLRNSDLENLIAAAAD